MIPVTQTDVGPTGNCLQASICSILEWPLDLAPDLPHDGGWYPLLDTWLRSHGWFYLIMPYDWFKQQQITVPKPKGYHLMGGPSPRGKPHSVVGCDGEMVFDPHPSRAGIETVDEISFLLPVHPSIKQPAG